ncbi:peptide deformylase [Stomatobaculum longum]|uniref:peptide deformylase n=1 Tax=Stomatobaculum longum TaxID=796942 RepID=UPI0028D8EEA2|nr:peptide deformylase [Stomatobaculum longum]
MALRNIREIGDPILNQRAKEVREMTPNLRALIEDMVETMRHANGVGLAAPQVGVLKRLVVIECEEGELHVLINPEIVERDGEQTGYEGCLSVPGKTGIVTRPNHVKVKALNENMEPVTVEGEELLARALCHELDHLDGHLYTEMAEELYTNEELEEMQAEEDEDEA